MCPADVLQPGLRDIGIATKEPERASDAPPTPPPESGANTQSQIQQVIAQISSEWSHPFPGTIEIPVELIPQCKTVIDQCIGEIAACKSELSPADLVFLELIPEYIRNIIFHGVSNFPKTATEGEGINLLHADDEGGNSTGSMAEYAKRTTMDFATAVADFAKRHPDLPCVNQLFVDQLFIAQIGNDQLSEMIRQYRQDKVKFYESFHNMNEAALTTNTEIDVARAVSIIKSESDRKRRALRVLFVGSGNGDRFEGPVKAQLEAQGVQFVRVDCCDMVDYSSNFAIKHPDMGFKKAEFKEAGKAFAGQIYDVVMLPWSVWSDILARKDTLLSALTASDLLDQDGVLVSDQPLPVGKHSYAQEVHKQAPEAARPGMMTRHFIDPENQQLESTFNICDMAEMTLIMRMAGLNPDNFPPTIAGQQKLMEEFIRVESELVVDTDRNKDPAKPLYHAGGWNRATFVFRKAASVNTPPSLLTSFLRQHASRA
jgi:hypothetical protein